MVRATRSTRWKLRVDQPRRSAERFSRALAAGSSSACVARSWACNCALATPWRARACSRALGARPGDDGAGLAGCQILQLARRDDRHLDEQVQSVEEGAAEPALVTRHLVGCAATGAQGQGFIAATNKWKRAGNSAWRAARKMRLRPVSSDSRRASSAARGNSGSSSTKQDPVLGQGDLAGPQGRAAADQGDAGGRMCHRQVEAATLLGQVGRRQVDRTGPCSPETRARCSAAPHAPASGLPWPRCPRANDGERLPAVGQMHFHGDRRGGEAVEGAGVDGGEGHGGAAVRPAPPRQPPASDPKSRGARLIAHIWCREAESGSSLVRPRRFAGTVGPDPCRAAQI